MANNYLEFSEVIERLTPEELQWWKDQQTRINEVYDNEANWDDNYDPYDDVDMCCDFAIEEDQSQIWFHGEGGDVEKVAHIIQQFLAKFRQTECFSLTWAWWCSKPRIGEFDGGAMFVTAQEVTFHNSYQWVLEQKNEWNENRGV